ncbi:MAG TPA: hypothetical protein VGR81_07575 [Candidatus Acidoferrales bacterium]|nr:hypothetical protein [Candidatus Acidoferrales bacterium]
MTAIPIYKNLPGTYAAFYWSTAFLTAIVGYGVILEIYGRTLEKFSGVARFMRIVLVGVLLAVIGRALLQLFGNSPSLLASSAALLEQDLRILQAVFLAALLGIFTFYRIPIGKNLRGIIAGYTLYIGVRIIELTIYTRFRKAEGIFISKLEPVSYLICLGIWTTALWSRSAEPNVEMASNIERDYEQLAGLTKSKLIRARAYLTRTVRS